MSSRGDWKQWTKGKPTGQAWPADWYQKPKGGVTLTASERERQAGGGKRRRKKHRAAQPQQQRASVWPATSPVAWWRDDTPEAVPVVSSLSAPEPVAVQPASPSEPALDVEGVLSFDGACTPNPGWMRCAYVLKLPMGREVRKAIDLGHGTCNIAEYQGLIAGLRAALAEGVTVLEAYGDSLLVIRGMQKGPSRGGKPHLEALKAEALRLARQFRRVEYVWVDREQNAEADAMASAR